MLSKQEEDRERRDPHLIGVHVPRGPGLSDEQKAKIEAKIEEAKASTLADHIDPPLTGRHAQTQTVVGQGKDPWPPNPNYWAAADMGGSRPFGKQLHSFDGGAMTVVQEKKP
jgi:hypothetical protein